MPFASAGTLTNVAYFCQAIVPLTGRPGNCSSCLAVELFFPTMRINGPALIATSLDLIITLNLTRLPRRAPMLSSVWSYVFQSLLAAESQLTQIVPCPLRCSVSSKVVLNFAGRNVHDRQ